MRFCPKCKSLLVQKDGKWFCPKCETVVDIDNQQNEDLVFQENLESHKEITVVEEEKQVMPIDNDIVCPKCGNKGAYYWYMQTRASDEPETKFYRCIKCNYTWRVYG